MPGKKVSTPKSVDKKSNSSAPLHIIAVGASAGGLEALQEFLSHLPVLENCCILIAQHLSPTHKSMLVQLLSRETALSVEEAEHGKRLVSNRVYITPPDKEITIVQGKIHLQKPQSAIGPKPSVDILFQSLAKEGLAHHTIGIILSGTGSDGAAGTIALKKSGGHLIAQEPETAKYNGMPLASIQTGMVDAVLAPAKMGEEIQEFLLDPLRPRVVKQTIEEAESALSKIFLLLGKRSGSDFSNYKSSTMGRRLQKRMAMINVASIDEYLKVIEQNPREIDEMFNMILIGVTTFFRDMEAFAALEDQLRKLIQNKTTKEPIRIWVPGCSTGEEAYSIAILLTRLLGEKISQYNIQIFATDIDDRAISVARKGIYSESSVNSLPAEIRDRYFVQNESDFELIKSIRSLVLFSKHDVLRNPPFLKLDLISCRNLLIYFNTELQQQVIPIFHYALNPEGYLFLGKSETVGNFSDLFAAVDTHNKLFQRKRGGSIHNLKFSAFKAQAQPLPNNKTSISKKELSTQELVKETLFQTYEHPYVVVNEAFDIVEVNGDVRLFLSLTAGGIHVNLIKMLNTELQIEVRSLLSKAVKERVSVKSNIRQFDLFGNRHFVRIQAKPLLFSGIADELFVVIFEILDIDEFVAKGVIENKEEVVNNRITELEQELAATKEHLQTYIEEIETSNEELQSLNEEMQSTNEELQSTNEELETANEELQSTTEEVQITYAELKNAHDELERKEFQLLLTQANTDALLNNKLQAFVLVDSTYKILKYNEKAVELFLDLRNKKMLIGESIIDLLPAGQIETFINDFAVAAAGTVFQTEKEFLNESGTKRWLSVNYSPVALGVGEEVAGVSLGILDITDLKVTISELNATERLVNAVFNAVSTGICVTDENGLIADVNDEYCDIYGYAREELIGQHFTMLVEPAQRKLLQQLHDKFIAGEAESAAEYEVVTKLGQPIRIAESADLLIQPDGKRFKVTSIRDISEEAKLQESVANNEKRLRALVENGADAVVILTAEGKPTYVSASISKVLGYSEEEALELNFFEIVHPDDAQTVDLRMQEVLANPGVPMPGITSRGKHKDGTWRWLEATVTNLLNDPVINGIVDNFKDVTERIEAEAKLKNSEEKYRDLFDLGPMPKLIYNLETYRIVDVNIAAEQHYGYQRDEFISMTIQSLHPEFEQEKIVLAHTGIATIDGLIRFGTFSHQKKDGTVIQVDVSGKRIQYDGQNCLTVVCNDVTERNELQQQQKQLVNTLEQRNSFIERVIEELPIGIAVNRITDGQPTMINKAFGKIYGWENADLTNVDSFFEKVYPDEIYRQEIMTRILEDIKTGDPKRMQWSNIMVVAENGEKRYVNAKNIPMTDQNLMISTVIDVTNEYISTTEIKESEARLSEAQSVAKVGSWETDLVNLSLTWSAETYRIFELDQASFHVTYASFIEHVHPDDREKVNTALEESLNDDRQTTIEHRIVTPNGDTKIVEERWKIVRNDSGLPAKAIGTCQDITERTKAEEKIKESNQRYEYVTKATFDAVWDWDIFSGVVFWSDAYHDLFGELNHDGLDDIEKVKQRIHPQDLELVLSSAVRTISSADVNWEMEHRYLKADGRYAFVQNKAVIVRDAKGKATRVIGAMQDITIRKQKEQQLKLMESVITNTNDAVLITEAEPLHNPGPVIVYVNDAFTRMTGYTSEEVIGKTPRILQGPKSDRKELDRLSDALQKWESLEITTINYKKNGEEFWINMSISPVADEKGWFTHWIAIERDVTKQKMRELQKQLLAEISRLFNEDTGLKPTLEIVLRNLVQYTSINLGEAWLLSADKKSLNLIGHYTTDERSELFYKEAGHISSFAVGSGLPGTVWEERKMIMWDCSQMGENYVRKDAAKLAGFTAAMGIPLLHNDEVVGVLVFMTSHDAQNLKQYKTLFTELETFLGAELKRKHLEEELNQIFNTAPDIICLADFDGYFKRMNIAGCKLLGYTEEELFSKPSFEFIHPDDRKISADAISSLAGGETIFYFENRYIKKDGSFIWLSWTCNSSIEDRLIYAVAKDITENKQLQELLDKANQLARIGSWEIDIATNQAYWSEVTRQIHEVDESYVVEIEAGLAFYKEGESRTKIKALIAAAMERGEDFDEELLLITAKGNERWVRAIGSSEFLDGKCIRVYGSFQDIHERKESQLELLKAKELAEENEHKMNEAQKLAHIGSWYYDFVNQVSQWSEETYNIWGLNQDITSVDFVDHQKLIHPKDWERFNSVINNAIEKGIPYKMDLELVRPDGSCKTVNTIGEPIFDENNKLVAFKGTTQDISDRVIIENELRSAIEKAEKSLKTLEDYKFSLDQSAIVAFTDSKGVITFINENFCKISKFSEEEIIGKTHKLVNSGHHPKSFFADLWKTIASGNVWRGEIKNKAKDGSHYWVDTTIVPFLDENNKPFQYLAIRFDITSRKIADEKSIQALEEKNTILERITEAFIALDSNWCYTHMNKKAGEIFNRDPEQMIGKHIWTEFPEGINQPFHLAYEKAMETQEYIHVEEHYKPYDLWLENHIYPSPNGISIFFRDISDRKKSEERLRQSNERFEKVTEATNDAIWDYDVVNNNLFWGKGFFSLFGYDAERTKPTFDLLVSLIHEEDRERIAGKVQQYIMDPQQNNWFEEYRFLKADGTYAFVIDRATFLRNGKGKAVRVVGAMTDITYRKEYEESLRKLNDSLDQRAKQLAVSNAELEQFAYIASHDLQEPLRMVTSFLTQVDKRYSSALDEKGKQYIHFAVDGAKRMRQIILDLLEYSRIGRAGSNPELVNLNELVEEIKFLFKRQIEEKEASIQSDSLPVLMSHRSPLRQLFQNLVGNALKYSYDSRPVHIDISVEETDTQFQFCIKDNGIGIDKEYFEKIFIIFQRLHNKDEYSGTGMGLSISKKIVESLGGKIWVQSKEGEGSSFYFTLSKPSVSMKKNPES